MTDTPLLDNYIAGRWIAGSGKGEALIDPVRGIELARASTEGIDLGEALAYARRVGGPNLRALSFGERAKMLDAIAKVFIANRAKYMETARDNSGNTERDASFDIDGAIGTLKYYSKTGAPLGDAKVLRDGDPFALGRDPSLEAVHLLTPRDGVAIHINAYNFPAWGTWEKAAVALLAGMAVLTKPATGTSLLTYQMVRDVVDANILPDGALSLLCGSARDLLDHVQSSDVVAFTGSAATAARVRGTKRVIEENVRVNCEADSLNAIVLGGDIGNGSPELEQFVAEVVREMTLKAGQKCTAIRRILVPASLADTVGDSLAAALSQVVVGDPRREGVTMGPVVSKTQQKALNDVIDELRKESSVVFEGKTSGIQADDPKQGAFVMPLLLRANGDAQKVHDLEPFGPVSTLIAYDSPEHALELVARGRGSLVTSVVTRDEAFARTCALALMPVNGRVLLLDESVSKANPGHGVVIPSCTHGGPGRAGNGEELGGLRGLSLYLQRAAIQGPSAHVRALAESAAAL